MSATREPAVLDRMQPGPVRVERGAASQDDSRTLVIQPRSGWIAIDWRELWDSREILGYLVLRDVKVRYKQTVLGVLWAVLQPLFTMVIFTIIFGRFAKIPSEGIPYAVFVFAGLLPWTYFSNAVTQASASLVNQQALLTKIYLPRLFVPGAAVGGGLIDLAISFIVFLGIMISFGVSPGWGFLALPLLVLLTTAAALGVGLVLAALTVSYRDFRYVVPFMIQSWMYLSPVIYPVSVVPQRWQWVLAINPMAGIIDGFRSALLERPWNFTTLTVSSVSSVLLLAYGLFYFRKTERRFADVA
ncbi:MAG TPA: ABC transporter permease [Caldimonas sp.]|nr:ABC transporter permease [Caldimonas sp.]